jgi:hypothetical protein
MLKDGSSWKTMPHLGHSGNIKGPIDANRVDDDIVFLEKRGDGRPMEKPPRVYTGARAKNKPPPQTASAFSSALVKGNRRYSSR